MYVFLFVLGIGVAIGLAIWGGRRARVYALIVAAGTIAFFLGLGLWADALWFDSVHLRADLAGERIDRARHALASEVKAATAQGLRVTKTTGGRDVTATLDV